MHNGYLQRCLSLGCGGLFATLEIQVVRFLELSFNLHMVFFLLVVSCVLALYVLFAKPCG